MKVLNSEGDKDEHELKSLKTKNGPSDSGKKLFLFIYYTYEKLDLTFDKVLCCR